MCKGRQSSKTNKTMGRRTRAHLSAARNLGHPIEGRQRKRRSKSLGTPRQPPPPEASPVSPKHRETTHKGLIAFGKDPFPQETLVPNSPADQISDGEQVQAMPDVTPKPSTSGCR